METLKQLGGRLKVELKTWSTAVMAKEADRRGLSVKQGQTQRAIVIESADGRKIVFRNGWTSWNTLLARRVLRNKEATAALLSAASVEVPEGHVFKKGEATRAWQFARDWDRSVVKPVDSRQGIDVYVGLGDEEIFRAAFDRVAEKHGKVLVQEHVSGLERRYLVADDKVVAVSERRPASVLGDGTSTIQELVDAKNASRPLIHEPVPLDEQALSLLRLEGKDAESVPAAGERVFLRGILTADQKDPNVAPDEETTVEERLLLAEARPIDEGGDFIDRTAEACPEAIGAAEAATQAIHGARLVGLDLIEPSDSNRGPTIIEINSSPLLASHYFPAEGPVRDVAKDIVEAMFPTDPETSEETAEPDDTWRGRFKVRSGRK